MNWRLEANCSGTDPELFFIDMSTSKRDVRVAKAICSNCTVIDECMAEALSSKSLGIWAGTDEYERAKMLNMKISHRSDLFDRGEYVARTKALGAK